MAYLIVGLGNPGAEYEKTRHNAGRIIVQEISKHFVGDKKVKLITPDTMMNRSGQSVTSAKNLMVIHDDLDLPLGSFKISWNRGAGGHRGVESIIKKLKTREFIRIRLGISGKKKPTDVLKHILGQFKPTELKIIKSLSKKAILAIELIISEGKQKAMTLYN